MQITTLGDLLLDVIVRLDRPLVAGDDQTAVTRTGAGGQAANVAAWARALGAEARFVGKSLFIGDADINFVTVRRAADRLRLLDY